MIERAHRIGKLEPGIEKPRTIAVKFLSFKDRDTVLKNSKLLKNTGIYINEDFSDAVQQRRREQIPKMKQARERGKIAYFSYDRLVIKDKKQ